MLGAALADVDALGIAAAQLDDGRGHQSVVEHHVGLLHQAQGAEGQQVGVTRAGADQVHLAQRTRRGAGDLGLEQAFALTQLAGEHALGDLPLEHVFPEHPALLHVGEQLLDPLAEFLRQAGQLAIGGRDPGLDLGADQPRQYRRITAAGDGDDQRRAVDDGREDHAAQCWRIHHVDRNAQRLRLGRDARVEWFVIGGGDHQGHALQVGAFITAQMHTALAGQRGELVAHLRRHHAQLAAGVAQQARLAQRDLAAADDQHDTPLEFVEQRKEIHDSASPEVKNGVAIATPPLCMCYRLSRSPRCRPCRA